MEDKKIENIVETEEVTTTNETVATEESMDDYKEMLDSSLMKFNSGDIVEGEVISVTDQEVLINFGYISDGIVPATETFADAENPLTGQYKVGDKVKAEVVRKDDGEGNVLLSLKKAQAEVVWENLEKAMKAETVVDALVTETVKGGLVCKVLQSRAFMPGSMISTSFVEDFSVYNGKTLAVKVMELDREKNRVIVSHKVIEAVENAKKKDALFASIKKGDVFTGTVKKLMHFGAFVDIGGADGLVPMRELGWKKVDHPKEVVKEGEVVQVTVINVDYDSQKIGLSMKDAKDDPWAVSSKSLEVGSIYDGKVKRVVDFGAFVEVAAGLEGLVHVSQMSKERVNHPSDVVKEGDEIKVKILGIDPEAKKLKLTMKTDEDVSEAAPTEEYVDIKKYQTNEKVSTDMASVFKNVLKDLEK